jgi:hypothetical protein
MKGEGSPYVVSQRTESSFVFSLRTTIDLTAGRDTGMQAEAYGLDNDDVSIKMAQGVSSIALPFVCFRDLGGVSRELALGINDAICSAFPKTRMTIVLLLATRSMIPVLFKI